MPPLTMRGRYLMREYWSDTDLFTRLSAAERELYQGLWMLADDSGWMPRDITGIGAALYRFEDRKPREQVVRDGIERLTVLGKVKSHRCGHLFLPAVERYPRSGKKSREFAIEHGFCGRPPLSHSNGIRTDLNEKSRHSNDMVQTDLNASPVPTSPVPTLPPAGASEFQRRVTRPA